MTHSPSEILQQLLVDLGFVNNSDDLWPAFVAFLPETSNNAVCVYDTAGRQDGRIMRSGAQIEHPGIQIMVRSQVFLDVWKKVEQIALGLDSVHRTEVAFDSNVAYLVLNVSRSGPPLYLGMDAQGDLRRHHFTINATLTINQIE